MRGEVDAGAGELREVPHEESPSFRAPGYCSPRPRGWSPAFRWVVVPSLAEREGETSGGIDQESSVGAAVERKVVRSQHPWSDKERERHPHQLRQNGAPRQRDVQDPQYPGHAPARRQHFCCLDHLLQQRCAPLVSDGRFRYLLGERHLPASGVLAVQTRYPAARARERATAYAHGQPLQGQSRGPREPTRPPSAVKGRAVQKGTFAYCPFPGPVDRSAKMIYAYENLARAAFTCTPTSARPQWSMMRSAADFDTPNSRAQSESPVCGDQQHPVLRRQAPGPAPTGIGVSETLDSSTGGRGRR